MWVDHICFFTHSSVDVWVTAASAIVNNAPVNTVCKYRCGRLLSGLGVASLEVELLNPTSTCFETMIEGDSPGSTFVFLLGEEQRPVQLPRSQSTDTCL